MVEDKKTYRQWYARRGADIGKDLSAHTAKLVSSMSWWSTCEAIQSALDLKNDPNINLLDAGSGLGRIIHGLKTRLNEIKVTGIELDPNSVEESRKLLSGFEFVQLRSADLLQDEIGKNEFTHVINLRVIHYFDEEQKKQFVDKIYAAMTPGGSLFFAIPNRYCPFRWITYRHAPLYHPAKLKELLQQAGFSITKTGSYNFFPNAGKLSVKRFWQRLEVGLQHLPGLGSMGGLYYVVARKP